MKNKFRQRIPGGVDASTVPIEFEFNTTDEFLSSDFIQNLKKLKLFDHFGLRGNNFMIYNKNRDVYFAVGYIKYPELIDEGKL